MPPLRFLGATISCKKEVVTDSKIMGKFEAKEKTEPGIFSFCPDIWVTIQIGPE